ncbi:MAG: ATP-grasp domain-containing protein, partial [Burkholderiaceae bacterium]
MNKTIEIVSIRHVRGPNMWTYWSVLEAIVDIHDLEDFPSNLIDGLPERLSAWVPTLVEHRCSIGERGGFLQRLRDGTWPGHILEHLSLELLELAGVAAGFGRARETSRRGVYKVVIGSAPPAVAEAALREARELLMAAIEDRPFDVDEAVERLRQLADRHCLGPSTACIVDAAVARRIPTIRMNDGNLVQIGHGANQRRIWTAETDRTSAIAETISRDKDLSKRLLASCGVPVPEGRLVSDVGEAWEAAEAIGLPVVVKPVDGNHGRGVFTCLDKRDEIEAAWRVAAEEGSGVIIERFVPGNEHRLLVVGDRVVAAARGETASVVGDGRGTVLELIAAQLNSDPRRGHTENHPLNPVGIDSPARLELLRQGLAPESVPAAGREVLIQRNGNVAFDVTDRIHPEVARVAALAARVIGLDIAGIDLVVADIGKPLAEQAGAIVEVNAGPGLLMHLRPAEGTPRPVGEAIVEHLFA